MAIEQIVEGLIPLKFKQMIRLRHKFIVFSDTVVAAIKKIEKEVGIHYYYKSLKYHVGIVDGESDMAQAKQLGEREIS